MARQQAGHLRRSAGGPPASLRWVHGLGVSGERLVAAEKLAGEPPALLGRKIIFAPPGASTTLRASSTTTNHPKKDSPCQ